MQIKIVSLQINLILILFNFMYKFLIWLNFTVYVSFAKILLFIKIRIKIVSVSVFLFCFTNLSELNKFCKNNSSKNCQQQFFNYKNPLIYFFFLISNFRHGTLNFTLKL